MSTGSLSPESIRSLPFQATTRNVEANSTSPLIISRRIAASPHDIRSNPHASCSPHLGTADLVSRHEARLIHHYATRLGRWLDCTDATRQFTLRVPRLTHHPILRHAVVSFAARHLGEPRTAEEAHARCVALLIPQLDSENVDQDEAILCAIVILRVFEQLNGVFPHLVKSRLLTSLQSWPPAATKSDTSPVVLLFSMGLKSHVLTLLHPDCGKPRFGCMRGNVCITPQFIRSHQMSTSSTCY